MLVIERLENIIACRQEHLDQRKKDLLEDIIDDLEVVSLVITSLDRDFVDIVRGFKDIQDKDELINHVDKTNKYLEQRTLLPKLEDVIGTIRSNCKDPEIQKNYIELHASLSNLVERVQTYRERLKYGAITGVGMVQELNSMSLIERAMECNYSAFLDRDPADMAKQVHFNQDFRLSSEIHELIGDVQFQVRKAKLR